MYYLLNWNDEHLDNTIVAARETKKEIQSIFKERILKRLVGLNVVNTEAEAADLWFKAVSGKDCGEILSVHETGGSILYGAEYLDCYHIVQFSIDPMDAFERVESDDYCYYIGRQTYSYTGAEGSFEFAPVVTFDLQSDEETILATFSAVILPKYFHPDVLRDEVLYPAGMESMDPADVTVLDLVREKASLIYLSYDEFADTGDSWDEMEFVQSFLTKAGIDMPSIQEVFAKRMKEPYNKAGTVYEVFVNHILHNTPMF